MRKTAGRIWNPVGLMPAASEFYRRWISPLRGRPETGPTRESRLRGFVCGWGVPLRLSQRRVFRQSQARFSGKRGAIRLAIAVVITQCRSIAAIVGTPFIWGPPGQRGRRPARFARRESGTPGARPEPTLMFETLIFFMIF